MHMYPFASMDNTNRLYVLKLRKRKYYVGKTEKTENIQQRLEEHRLGQGSVWTRMYPVTHVLKIKAIKSRFDEDNYIKKLMMRYGIANVRGGSYSQINLPREQVISLRREFRNIRNECLRCGRVDHIVDQCSATTEIVGFCDPERPEGGLLPIIDELTRRTITCYHCKCVGHCANECYAFTRDNGILLNYFR